MGRPNLLWFQLPMKGWDHRKVSSALSTKPYYREAWSGEKGVLAELCVSGLFQVWGLGFREMSTFARLGLLRARSAGCFH